MARIVEEATIPDERIRELIAAYDAHNHKRDELLVESPNESTHEQRIQLRRWADESLWALLEEGISEGVWTTLPRESGPEASEEKECILIENEQCGLPVLRRAPYEAVELAPEWAPPRSIEENAPAILKSRYRRPISRVVTALALSSLGAGLAAVAAVLVSVFTDTALWPHAAAGIIAFVLCSVILNVLKKFRPDSPEQIIGSEYREDERAELEAHGRVLSEQQALHALYGERQEQTRSGSAEQPIGMADVAELCDASSRYWARDRQQERQEIRFSDAPRVASFDHEEPANSAASDDPSEHHTVSHADSDACPPPEKAQAPSAEQDPDELHHQRDENRRDRLNNIREEDLREGFSYAHRRVENQDRGSEATRVVEARGELAGILGIAQGEALMEITWRMEGRAGYGRSYLPYREVAAGTSLDPARPPADRVRPESRDGLHKIIEAEKAVAGLSPKVTYRIGPDREQFFNLPHRSEGRGEGYTLEDKLEYLQGMAARLGFENHYTADELERMDEIMMGEGYAPENEELLRFALVAGVDPRFLFEQASPGEDLRSPVRTPGRSAAKKAGAVWLWRVEAAISEAHGLPVEIFERKLIPWHISRHSWRFR